MQARQTVPLLTLLLGLTLTSLALAGSALDSFSLGLEKEIGRSAYQQVQAEHKTARLPRVQAERLGRIFARLTPVCSRARELEFTLTAIEDPSVNAFALPGGYIFVHDSLLPFAANDGELAGVLAHEIAHVDRRHGMKAVYRSVGMSLLLEIVVNKSDPRRRERMAKIGATAIGLTLLGYGREAEYEADRYRVFHAPSRLRQAVLRGFPPPSGG